MPIPIVSDKEFSGTEIVAVIWCEELKQNVGIKITFTVESGPSGFADPKDPFSEGTVYSAEIDEIFYHFFEDIDDVTDFHIAAVQEEKYQKEYRKIVDEAFETMKQGYPDDFE